MSGSASSSAPTATAAATTTATAAGSDPIKQLRDATQLCVDVCSFELSSHTRSSITSFRAWLRALDSTPQGVTAALVQALLMLAHEQQHLTTHGQAPGNPTSTSTSTTSDPAGSVGMCCLALVLDPALIVPNGDRLTLAPYDVSFLQQIFSGSSDRSYLVTRYCHSPTPGPSTSPSSPGPQANTNLTWQLNIQENFFSTDASSFDARVVSRFLSSDGFKQQLVPVRLRQTQAGEWRVLGWHCLLAAD